MARQPNGRPAVYQGADKWWHSFVTVGTKPDGSPRRKHVKRKDAKRAAAEVDRILDQVKRTGTAPTARADTVADWLRYWLANIVRPNRARTTWRSYRAIVETNIIPAIGHRRLAGARNVLEPEHLEQLYARMRARGLSGSYVKKTHHTLSVALDVAFRRDKATRNVCELVDKPQARRRRIKSYDLVDAQALLAEAASDAMAARWMVGLLLGPRQGEALGVRWPRLKLAAAKPVLLIETQIQRYGWEHGCKDPQACAKRKCRVKPCGPSWEHACADPARCRAAKNPRFCPDRRRIKCRRHARDCPSPCAPNCTKHASTCPERVNGGLVEVDVKSEKGEREIPLPPAVVAALERRRQDQMREAHARGERWDDQGLVFTQPNGAPIDPRRDWAAWRALTRRAGVPDGRLHAARHTAATLLIATGSKIEEVQELLGHTDIRTARGYIDVAAEAKAAAVERLAAALLEGQLGVLLQPNGATPGPDRRSL